ncbi:MAG: hypothetical protein WB815_01905 [Nitrososphaeraceae archaeon]
MKFEKMRIDSQSRGSVSTLYLLTGSELSTMSRDAFLAISIASSAAVSITGVIPSLSAPFLIPEKNVSNPNPTTAKKKIITNINAIKPIIAANHGNADN